MEKRQSVIYKSRRDAQQKFWDLPERVRAAIGADLEKTFTFLFEQLRVTGTRAATDRYVKPKLVVPRRPTGRTRVGAG